MNREIKFRFWLGHIRKMTYSHSLQEVSKIIPEFTDDIIPLQFTGLKDKNWKEIYEGDIVEGRMGWLKGDGRLRKGFPSEIRVRLEVRFSDGREWEAGFYLLKIGVHPEDKSADDAYFYRSVNFELRESRECELKDNEIVWMGKCNTLEVLGNKYENPELLETKHPSHGDK